MMIRPIMFTALFLLAACLVAPRAAHALGEESFGNAQVSAVQDGWPKGILEAINLESRVYSRWVNGNESFFFRGDLKAANEALRQFAAVELEIHEVLLRPGPGGTSTFDGTAVACDWELHVPSGLYLGGARREKGTQVYRQRANLTIWIHPDRIQLDDLTIPKGVKALGLETLQERLLQGLQSQNQSVRGQAAYRLGSLPSLAESSVKPLVRALEDESGYVRVSAAGALSRLGGPAKSSLPAVRQAAEKAKTSYRQSIEKAIELLQKPESPEDKARRESRSKLREAIRKFLK